MPNNNYARGAAFENKVKQYLENKGYYAVRAAGSHGLTDVVAIPQSNKEPILFIQCKSGKGRMSPADRKALFEVAWRYGADPISARQSAGGILFERIRVGDYTTYQLDL